MASERQAQFIANLLLREKYMLEHVARVTGLQIVMKSMHGLSNSTVTLQARQSRG